MSDDRKPKSVLIQEIESLRRQVAELQNSDAACRQAEEARAAAERALRRTNRRINNILDSIQEAFLALDREWRLTYINPAAERLMHHKREELLGKNLWEEFPGALETVAATELHRAASKQVAVEFEQFVPQTGRWLYTHAYPSQDGLSLYVRDITTYKQTEEALRQSVEKLHRSAQDVVRALTAAVELCDPSTAAHQRRVSALACAMAREIGFSAEHIEVIRIAGLLHDTGMISLPARIISKPGHLSTAEFTIIQTHAHTGYDLLKEIQFAPEVALVALQHHERLDGSGYPAGLAGNAILPEARLVAVADVVEAMASHRPYRPALGLERALEEVWQKKGRLYDAEDVEACLQVCTAVSFDFEQVLSAQG